MRVGHLTFWLSTRGGGVPAVIAPLARAEQRIRDTECRVFGLLGRSEPLASAEWEGVAVRPHVPVDRGVWGYAPGLVTDLLAANLDLVHHHGLWRYPSFACLRWSGQCGRPYMISPHGMLDPWALGARALKKQLAGWLYQRQHLERAGCLHALNESEAKSVRALGLTNPIAVIPNAVDMPQPEEYPSAAPWAGLVPEGARVMLFLSRIHLKKGVRELLLAWKSARARAPQADWHLVIAGWSDDGFDLQMKQLTADNGLSGSVHFTGPLFGKAKRAAYRHAQAFVLPSKSEGLPMAVLEAWSYGLPVLMTDSCNIPEGFARGAAVRISENAPPLAQELAGFLGTAEAERTQMGRQGRRLVQERFSWDVVAPRMVEVYRWLVGGGGRPGHVLA